MIPTGEDQMSDLLNLSKKVLLLGDPGVGKTSLIRKFVYNMFDDTYISTLGAKVSSKRVIYDYPSKNVKIELKLMIWDVMGQDNYEIFHKSAFAGSQGALIVCDLTRDETIDNWLTWKTDLFKLTGEIPVIMIGNKNDLSGQIGARIEKLKELSKDLNIPLFFTSAKTGENIVKVFFSLGEDILKNEYD